MLRATWRELETELRDGLRHRQMAKAAGKRLLPGPTTTAPAFDPTAYPYYGRLAQYVSKDLNYVRNRMVVTGAGDGEDADLADAQLCDLPKLLAYLLRRADEGDKPSRFDGNLGRYSGTPTLLRLQPDFSLALASEVMPWAGEIGERLLEGWRKAGVPER